MSSTLQTLLKLSQTTFPHFLGFESGFTVLFSMLFIKQIWRSKKYLDQDPSQNPSTNIPLHWGRDSSHLFQVRIAYLVLYIGNPGMCLKTFQRRPC